MRATIDDGLDCRVQLEQRGSKGEKQIGRMLTRYDVRYFYEHPVAVIDRGKVRVWYCDFWLPDYGMAIEYAGVINDENYSAGIEHKKMTYAVNGISCVFVDARSLRGYWPKQILEQVRSTLVDRLARFDALDRGYGGG